MNLAMPGEHNVQNSLAAIAVAHELGVNEAQVRAALDDFGGVKRRFSLAGEWNGIAIYDDYAHHPVEIAAVLGAARSGSDGRIIAVVQPHRYSRLKALFDDFCTSFNDADIVLVADVYAAGEAPIEGASQEALIAGLRAHGHRQVRALEGPESLPRTVAEIAAPGDMVICMGAGNITAWANALPQDLEDLSAEDRGDAAAGGRP